MIGVTEDESLVCKLHSFPSAPVWAVPGVVDCLAPQESLLWAVAQHLLHLPLASNLAEVGDGSSVSRADVSSGSNLESMEVALEALRLSQSPQQSTVSKGTVSSTRWISKGLVGVVSNTFLRFRCKSANRMHMYWICFTELYLIWCGWSMEASLIFPSSHSAMFRLLFWQNVRWLYKCFNRFWVYSWPQGIIELYSSAKISLCPPWFS